MAFDVEWCDVKCGGNDVVRDAMVIRYTDIPHLNNISHRTTYLTCTTRSHIIWCDVDNVAWNLVRCEMFCNARCGVLCLIHPNVAVMWNKARCYMRCHATSDEVLWNSWWCDVEWWCGICGIQSCADARCEMWLWNTEWRGVLDNLWWCDAVWWLKCSIGCVVWFGMCAVG